MRRAWRWLTQKPIRTALVLLTVYLLALGGFTAFGFYHDRIQDDRRCQATLLSRQGSLAKDIRVWTRFGHEIDAPQERIDAFLDGIREDYEDLPVPADCT